MKVLHVIPSLSMVNGGPTKAMHLIEKTLKEQKISIETVTTDDNGVGKHNGRQQYVEYQENGIIRRYFYKNIEFYKVSINFARWIFDNIHHYELVHIHALFSFTSVLAAWAARRAGVPYIIRPLGTLANYGITQRRPWLKRLSLTMIEAPLLRHAAAIHFTSQAEKQEADSLGIPMRGVVIPLGIEAITHSISENLIVERYPQIKNKTVILFLSRLDPKKNIEGLLKAFSICNNVNQEACLMIAGDGNPEYVQSLKSLSNSLGLDTSVIWTGQLTGDIKASIFNRANIFVLPSFSENFGIAVAEALMAGLPCIVGKGVAISSQIIAAKAGIAVETSPESIADGLKILLHDDSLKQEMAMNAKQLAHNEFSIDTMGKHLADLYLNIISQQKHMSC